MGLTWMDDKDTIAVHIFTKYLLNNFKSSLIKELGKDLKDIKELASVSKVFDYKEGKEVVKPNNRQSKSVILKNLLNQEFIDKLSNCLYKELNSVNNIIIENTVTIIFYDKGDFFLEHRDFIPLFINDIKCMHLLLYLESPIKGGETAIYLKEHSRDTIKIKSDVIFDKSILHESLKVEEGTKCVALFNVLIDQKSSEECIIGKINHFNTDIILYNNESEKLSLCYCDFEIRRFNSENQYYSAGVILDRSGKCVKVHIDKKIPSINEYILYPSFEVFCIMSMDIDDIDNIWIDKGKNIAWESIDKKVDSCLPKDIELYEKLVNIASKEHAVHVKMLGNCNVENEYISCSVSKYYFNLSDRNINT